MPSITLSQLENEHAWNLRRRELLKKLKEELDVVVRCSSGRRVVIFGSYLTAKEDPGDIDLIITADRRFGQAACGTGVDLSFRHPKDIQIKPCWRWGCSSPLPSAESLVTDFNKFPSNVAKGILIAASTWMELV